MTENTTPQTIGKYNIVGTLGRGAMGVVYKGFDPLIERTVAIKVIRKAAFADDELHEALDRFRREAQAAGRLIHPNIVTVYEYGEEENTAFIAMEYVEGSSLKEQLDTSTPFSMAEIKDIISQLLTGLSYAHASGIVHRDIKPDNLIFAPDGTLKIMDFGVARLESSSLTMAGSVMGTPAYMAPEIFSGEEVDQRTDLFSAAIILYQLLTGYKPFSGPTITAIMHQVVNVMPANPSQLDSRLPAPLDRLLETALAKNPGNRFQNGSEFLQALEQAFRKVDTRLVAQSAGANASTQDATLYAPAPQESKQAQLLDKMRSLPLPVYLGCAAALLVVIILLLWLGAEKSDQEPISSAHKQEVVDNAAPPKALSPTATKKKVVSKPKPSPTGITITTSGSDDSKKSREEPPPSRTGITITVPDRR